MWAAKVRIKASRVAWLYMTGAWPAEVRHINRDGSDDRWANLRELPRHSPDVRTPLSRHERAVEAQTDSMRRRPRRPPHCIRYRSEQAHSTVLARHRIANRRFEDVWRPSIQGSNYNPIHNPLCSQLVKPARVTA